MVAARLKSSRSNRLNQSQFSPVARKTLRYQFRSGSGTLRSERVSSGFEAATLGGFLISRKVTIEAIFPGSSGVIPSFMSVQSNRVMALCADSVALLGTQWAA